MASKLYTLWKCIFGPRLYRIYREGPEEGRAYVPNCAEAYPDNVIRSLSFLYSLSVYTSPVIIGVLYRRSYFAVDGIYSFLKFFTAVGLILLGSLWIRGIGRYCNQDYVAFISVLDSAQRNFNRDTKRLLLRYDFDFYAFPAEFRWNTVEEEKSKTPIFLSQSFQGLSSIPINAIGYIIAHTIGRRMVYPGTVGVLQAAMGSMLLQGRTKLVEEYGGERVKLVSKDEYSIDVMVLDRRGKANSPNANTLVICTDGNAGFYEVGIMSTPVEAGYSVIGWNHPGFGGSTGVPFPEQEANAIDVVIQYAIHQLKFNPSDIVLFAWSIGGYSASWAAMNYPEIKGLILDATFDDLVPLAVAKMPASWKMLVKRIVRDHLNLNNVEQLAKYSGPVLFIRRTNDEMISTDESHPLKTNRGNFLLLQFLKHRYPRLMDDRSTEILNNWLAVEKNEKNALLENYGVDQESCSDIISSYFQHHSHQFPCMLGEGMIPEEKIRMTLFLAGIYMVDYNSTHCTPLPKQYFKLPWDPFLGNGFQQIHGDSFSKN